MRRIRRNFRLTKLFRRRCVGTLHFVGTNEKIVRRLESPVGGGLLRRFTVAGLQFKPVNFAFKRHNCVFVALVCLLTFNQSR